jgi:hypothetical protein
MNFDDDGAGAPPPGAAVLVFVGHPSVPGMSFSLGYVVAFAASSLEPPTRAHRQPSRASLWPLPGVPPSSSGGDTIGAGGEGDRSGNTAAWANDLGARGLAAICVCGCGITQGFNTRLPSSPANCTSLACTPALSSLGALGGRCVGDLASLEGRRGSRRRCRYGPLRETAPFLPSSSSRRRPVGFAQPCNAVAAPPFPHESRGHASTAGVAKVNENTWVQDNDSERPPPALHPTRQPPVGSPSEGARVGCKVCLAFALDHPAAGLRPLKGHPCRCAPPPFPPFPPGPQP